MIKLIKKEWVVLLFFIAVFIGLRSLNFIGYLTFIGWDQAEHAILALNLVRDQHLVLIGPRISAVLYQGRQIFLGPAMTYIMAFFLSLGNWDPAIASYLFMVASGLMIVPLYFGIKWLIGKHAAWIMVIVYTLLPYYLTYTRFMWNPNFQFAMLPILFFLMGYYRRSQKNWVFFLVAFWLGILFQLHYQFIISVLLISAYYFFFKKEGWRKFFIYSLGFLVSVSPLILFELRHQFYLTNTLILFARHYKDLEMLGNRDHYYLSLSFVLLVGFLALANNYIKKIKPKSATILLSLLFVVLFAFSSKITFVKPDTSFWSPWPYWNYPAEVRAYDIIKKEGLTDFNVTNQLYDPLAMIQKYMMMRDGIVINYEDYWENKYLFVIDQMGKKNYMDNPGYEVLYFRPFKVLKSWNLNDHFQMHLVERGEKE